MRWMVSGLCVAFLVGCTQAPIARPPVVDASWRANEDDRRIVVSTPEASGQTSENQGSTKGGEPRSGIPIEPVARIEPVDQPAAPSSISPAVLSLLQQADSLREAGDLAGASARLERAQRIAPDEPEVYYQLSTVRFEQDRFEEAANIAGQAVDFAVSDNAMKRDLYTLIARARDALGDTAGAGEARRLARSFGS